MNQGNQGGPAPGMQLQHQLMQNQQVHQGGQQPVQHGQMHQMLHQQNHPQQQPQAQQQQSNSQTERFDHIGRVRGLVCQLKSSLQDLMKIAASNINHNSQIDTGLKTSESKVSRFDKALEEFFSICNQIELHLKTIGECVVQQRDSQKYIPFPVSTKVDSTGVIDAVGPEVPISYSQYLSTIKSQIHFAKVVQEILLDGARKITQPFDPAPNMQHMHGQQANQQMMPGQMMQQMNSNQSM